MLTRDSCLLLVRGSVLGSTSQVKVTVEVIKSINIYYWCHATTNLPYRYLNIPHCAGYNYYCMNFATVSQGIKSNFFKHNNFVQKALLFMKKILLTLFLQTINTQYWNDNKIISIELVKQVSQSWWATLPAQPQTDADSGSYESWQFWGHYLSCHY